MEERNFCQCCGMPLDAPEDRGREADGTLSRDYCRYCYQQGAFTAPEATMEVVERPTPGIPEAMRAESMKITPKGCLSRSAAGIRGRSLIINLPGSKKASAENILAVIDPVAHGLDMLYSEGSADCAK